MSNQFYNPGQVPQQDYVFNMAGGDDFGSELDFQNYQSHSQSFGEDPNLYKGNPYLHPNAPGDDPKIPSGVGFEDEPPLLEASPKSDPPLPSQSQPQPVLTNSIKYNWYQTEKQVVVDALIKNVKPDCASVNIAKDSVTVEVNVNNVQHRLTIELKHEINVATSSYKILSTKIELKLNKLTDLRWTDLEKKEEKEIQTPLHPFKTDWEKVVKQIEDEKKEGEAALNELFQKIYGEGSDEVRKAMNKSFLESGGTVLSTNWNDVSNSKVEVKPPEGLEFKKWDE